MMEVWLMTFVKKLMYQPIKKFQNEPLDVQSVQNVFETSPAVKLLPVVSKDGRLVNILPETASG